MNFFSPLFTCGGKVCFVIHVCKEIHSISLVTSLPIFREQSFLVWIWEKLNILLVAAAKHVLGVKGGAGVGGRGIEVDVNEQKLLWSGFSVKLYLKWLYSSLWTSFLVCQVIKIKHRWCHHWTIFWWMYTYTLMWLQGSGWKMNLVLIYRKNWQGLLFNIGRHA